MITTFSNFLDEIHVIEVINKIIQFPYSIAPHSNKKKSNLWEYNWINGNLFMETLQNGVWELK